MESTRLPGKVLKLIGAYPTVYHVYHRARMAVPNTVVVIPATAANDPLAAYLVCQDVATFRWDGPVEDVLGRYEAALQTFPGDPVVRITADCPFLDPTLIAECLHRYRQQDSDSTYVSNTCHRTYPRGLDVEVFSRRLLEAAHALAMKPHDREHVTPMIRALARHTVGILAPRNHSAYRWTLDTPDDLAWCRAVADAVGALPPDPTPHTLLALLDRRPELRRYDAAPLSR